MEKAVIPVLILLVVLALALSFLSFTLIAKNLVQAQEESVKTPIKTYSYTKAICNSKNYCQDYHIICNSNGRTEMNPITGAAVQFPPGWKDPRSEDAGNNFCG